MEMEDVMALFMFIIELVQTNTDPLKRKYIIQTEIDNNNDKAKQDMQLL